MEVYVSFINFIYESLDFLVCLFCVSVPVCTGTQYGESSLLWLWPEAVKCEFQNKPYVLRTWHAFRVGKLSPLVCFLLFLVPKLYLPKAKIIIWPTLCDPPIYSKCNPCFYLRFFVPDLDIGLLLSKLLNKILKLYVVLDVKLVH